MQGESSLLREFAIPQASRLIDGLVVADNASEAWGPIHPLMSHRLVAIEHFSRPPAVPALSWVIAKHSWLSATWRDRSREGKKLRALLEAGGREGIAPRPPRLLVLCCGLPRRAQDCGSTHCSPIPAW